MGNASFETKTMQAESDGSGENEGINNDTLEVLLAIKSTTEKLRLEVTGGAAFQDEECVGLAENNSLKQVQEEMLFQMKTMNKNIEALLGKLEESLKLQEAKVKDESPQLVHTHPVVEIRFLDAKSWMNFWMEEITRMQRHLRVLVDGMSLQGTTLPALAQAIPHPPLSDEVIAIVITEDLSRYQLPNKPTKTVMDLFRRIRFSVNEEYSTNRKPVIVEFCNHSPFQLQTTESFFRSFGSIYGQMPEVIRPGTKDVICFYVGKDDEGIRGICSYEISTTGWKLTLVVKYNFSGQTRKWGLQFGIAFTPINVPITTAVLTNTPKVPATEFNFDAVDTETPGNCKIIQSKNLLAAATVSMETFAVVLSIQILQYTQMPSIPLAMESVTDGYTIPKPSFDWKNLLEEKVGCVVKIENRLNVALQSFNWHFDPAVREYVLPPPEISRFTREMFYVLNENSAIGMISYIIENTDLRLAVVFCTRPEKNQFAIGFISHDAVTDGATMNSLTLSEHWKTRPYIYVNADEGKQILEFRNFRLIAAMTTDAQASLKLSISAF